MDCPVGTYNDLPGQVDCKKCPGKNYISKATVCCETGYSTSISGECIACYTGYYSIGGTNATCEGECPSNHAIAFDLQTCITCPYSQVFYIVASLIGFFVSILLLRKFIQFSNKYPGAVGGV